MPAVSGLLALILGMGMGMVLGYAPFHLFPLSGIALACQIALIAQQTLARRAAFVAFCFGLGMFGAGVSWIYVSLHTYGEMPVALAVVATTVFCAFLALFPTLFGVLCWYARRRTLSFHLLTIPALWVGTEWLRGTLFTGFPWLTIGYSQVADSPLLGYAPIIGVYGISALVAASAAMLLYLMSAPTIRKAISIVFVLGVWGLGAILQQIVWTSPTGPSFSVALLQGNIAQDRKWRAEELVPTLQTYLSLLQQSNAELTVLPETAIPLVADQLPSAYAAELTNHALSNSGDMIVGIVERASNNGNIHHYNSAISMGASSAQTYRKQHLVPFGEYIPAKPIFGWILNVLHVPLMDMSAGASPQPTLHLAGQKVAVNICFEDVFGEEVIRALPDATILVNLSNIAWFGDSLAVPQHLQISQMRALETGRYMSRSTNTGATAIIDERGRVLKQARPHEALVLTGLAQGFIGATPYVRWGNTPILMFIGAGVLLAFFPQGSILRKGRACMKSD
ncbi:apolipoprotein N-acyltransferase [Allopusillimonas ginsengisoli]|uniref:apolipoprotein N-acyltransferase n=1 Tax=Allopusillimonas ginsengisoli TaxID=453575 RepID=UPI0039C16579